MATLNLNKAEFLKSAVSPSGFLAADLPCIVFAGKSNVGKSSVINRLLNRKNFARVGSQPGKTVHVNYFCIDGRAYFVDLPGYGYASVAKTERARWGKLMEDFFADPARITLGVMIVDARHRCCIHCPADFSTGHSYCRNVFHSFSHNPLDDLWLSMLHT